MKTTKIMCDHCGKDITEANGTPDFRLRLVSEAMPHRSGIVCAVLVDPEIEQDHYFCELQCLRDWVAGLYLTTASDKEIEKQVAEGVVAMVAIDGQPKGVLQKLAIALVEAMDARKQYENSQGYTMESALLQTWKTWLKRIQNADVALEQRARPANAGACEETQQ